MITQEQMDGLRVLLGCRQHGKAAGDPYDVHYKCFRSRTEGAATGDLPAAVVHLLGQRHNEDLVVVRLADFQEWAEEA